ncbi:MAG: hypothetical protein ABL951_09820 [Alphaproteobacteria bacterium]
MQTRERMGIFRISCYAMFLIVMGGSAFAAPDLTVAGAQLPPVILTDVTAAIVEKQVALEADVAEVTHVVVQMAGSQPLMRDRQGMFQPWNENSVNLADNGFSGVKGRLLFKVFNQDLSAQNFPIRVTVYYRAGGELKFGYFDVMRAN